MYIDGQEIKGFNSDDMSIFVDITISKETMLEDRITKEIETSLFKLLDKTGKVRYTDNMSKLVQQTCIDAINRVDKPTWDISIHNDFKKRYEST